MTRAGDILKQDKKRTKALLHENRINGDLIVVGMVSTTKLRRDNKQQLRQWPSQHIV